MSNNSLYLKGSTNHSMPFQAYDKDSQYFHTLKRYSERLNQQKNISLNYLQNVNRLTEELNRKNQQLQKISKQNQNLKDKLILYENIMTRSRITLKQSNIISSTINKNVPISSALNGDSTFDKYNNYNSIDQFKMGNFTLENIINQSKFTQSIMETRNELEYQNESRETFQPNRLIFDTKQSIIITEDPQSHKLIENNVKIIPTIRRFPLFEDFIIIKPTQNQKLGLNNLSEMKHVFRLNDSGYSTKHNKINENICTYICHNNGDDWKASDYKAGQHQKDFKDSLIIYVSNSQETLMPPHSRYRTIGAQKPSIINSNIFKLLNPSLYYIGIGLLSYSFEYHGQKLVKVPVVYLFITRYPLIKIMKDMLQVIRQKLDLRDYFKMSRLREQLQSVIRMTERNNLFLQRQQQIIVRIFDNNLKYRLPYLSQSQCLYESNIQLYRNNVIGCFKSSFLVKKNNIKINNKQISSINMNNRSLEVMKTRRTSDTEKEIGSPQREFKLLTELVLGEIQQIFTNYNIELIVDVLMLLLLEIPITVISLNEELLNKFVFYFTYAIKPLKYPFPIVCNLPQTMITVLESPFPSFLGVTSTKMVENYMLERAVFDLDEKIAKSWPNIDFYNQSRNCILRWIDRTIQPNELGLDKINQIVKIVLRSSRHYPDELKEFKVYRKYFKRTQIWNIYYHQKQLQSNNS